MNRKRKDITNLYHRYLQNECTLEEVNYLFDYFNTSDIDSLHRLVEDALKNDETIYPASHEEHLILSNIYSRIRKEIFQENKKLKTLRLYPFLQIASVIVLAVGIYFTWYYFETKNFQKQITAAANSTLDIQPGHSGALLHLSDGKVISLENTENGIVANQENVQIIKSAGEIKYSGKSKKIIYNTISTDKGREWKVLLPDGSKVWLNAGSSITYPIAFNGNTRPVLFSGEGYFEVIHNAKQPFRVNIGNQIIEDVGTSFNINTYSETQQNKVTLIEGSIKIIEGNEQVLLQPKQQAIAGEKIKIQSNVNVNNVLAWRDGYFSFQDAGLKDIMSQISRWYNVEIEYQGDVHVDKFTGRIPRNIPISSVLKILQEAGGNFSIAKIPTNGNEGKIIVSP